MRNEIVVGLDDSPSGKAALDWAAGQATSVGATLRAVHVLDWPYGLSSIGFPRPVDMMNVSREELDDSYRQAITEVFEAVSPYLGWTLHFASGDTGKVLVQQSKDARLLVGTREHIGLGRLLSGSVSHYCLSHAACPVVAVPASVSDRRAEDSDMVGPKAAVIIEEDEDLGVAIPAAETTIDSTDAAVKTRVVVGVGPWPSAYRMEAAPSRRRNYDNDRLWRPRRSARTVVTLGGRLDTRAPTPAALGIMDAVGGSERDEADTLPAHCAATGHGGA
jgi:nucleotide-binding universal stress UspA family protein